MWLIDLLAAGGAAIWLIVLLLPWQPWRTTERLEPNGADPGADLTDLTVLIPARDEAAVLADTLAALAVQAPAGRGPAIIVIDDQSTDGTAAVAGTIPNLAVTVIEGTTPPAGWSGKLWALEQGRRRAATPCVLLLDADIVLAPGMIRALRGKQADGGLALVSLMAALRMASGWERLLMPAFVFFFKLLYPFRLANRRTGPVAAAAGGVMLIDRRALAGIGGFGAIHDALIDDCALARAFKRAGHRTWIGLTHGAVSARRYDDLGTIWAMVARTAYTQLRHSIGLLLLCTGLMIAAFWGLLLAPAASGTAVWLGLGGGLAMLAAYVPTLRYYRRAWIWALALPAAGTLFLAMTWTSAINHWRGHGASWKGRDYRSLSIRSTR